VYDDEEVVSAVSIMEQGRRFMTATLEEFGIDQLSLSDRIELIGKIWDSIDANDVSTIPAWHMEELDRRMDAADATQEPLDIRD